MVQFSPLGIHINHFPDGSLISFLFALICCEFNSQLHSGIFLLSDVISEATKHVHTKCSCYCQSDTKCLGLSEEKVFLAATWCSSPQK